MAVPKHKISTHSANTRFSQWKLESPNLSECSQCHELIESHKVCPKCGYYKGKQIVVKKEKTEK